MTPILIYSREEANRNAFVAKKICARLGAKLVEPDYRGDCSFVINRTNDWRIAERFERQGKRVFNSSAFSRLANDKQSCYDFVSSNGIEIMPTRYSVPPFVKKPGSGHGGAGVTMCFDSGEYDPDFVCQKAASDLGRDVRVWILGGKIITSVLRVNDADFRSNFSLGGKAVPYTLSRSEEAQVKKIISLAGGDYYGIDFVFDGGRAVFNELEDAVGARMVYAITDIDIIDLFCDYVLQEMKIKS